MKNPSVRNAQAAIAALPGSCLSLMAEFPLRPIKHGAEYDRAAKIVHRLALREGELDSGEKSYLEVYDDAKKMIANFGWKADLTQPGKA